MVHNHNRHLAIDITSIGVTFRWRNPDETGQLDRYSSLGEPAVWHSSSFPSR